MAFETLSGIGTARNGNYLTPEELVGIQLILLTGSYIVDFEKWSYAEDSPTWHEGLFRLWHLLIWTPSGEYKW